MNTHLIKIIAPFRHEETCGGGLIIELLQEILTCVEETWHMLGSLLHYLAILNLAVFWVSWKEYHAMTFSKGVIGGQSRGLEKNQLPVLS